MKKENKIRSLINKSSFQTQLFTIVLLCLISFVILEYTLILYSFRNRYYKNEISNLSFTVNALVDELNDDKDNISYYLYQNYKNNGLTSLVVDNSNGSYKLKEETIDSIIITFIDNEIEYKAKIYDYSILLKDDDSINGYIRKLDDEYYTFDKLVLNNKLVIDNIYDSESIYIHSSIKSVIKPDNINFIFKDIELINNGLKYLDNNILEFTNFKIDNASYSEYYTDRNNSNIFILIKPDCFNDTDDFLLISLEFVDTEKLLSLIQSYYGYIILGSVIVAVLIALFISMAFSKPVETIEKEITKLKNSDYEISQFKFKNREMITLQDSLNEVKIDIKEKVENINRQKESLEKLNNELLRENELRSSFIARLSHELKTPLMVISATTEALMSGLINEEDIMNEYNNILDEVDKTTGIIKDIINTYKTSTKETKLEISRFDLSELTKETLEPLLPLAQKNNLNIKTNIIDNVYIDADIKLIKQVISNFITNAFKYTNEGNEIDINIIDNENSTLFEIKNYGSKISESNLDKIWLPFFRENENIKSTSTGMGLYIVKEILIAHKFEYNVTNFEDGVISYFKINKKE